MFNKSLDSRLHNIMSYTPDINCSNGFAVEFVSNYQAIQVGIRNTFGYIRQSPDVRQAHPQPIARPRGQCRMERSQMSCQQVCLG